MQFNRFFTTEKKGGIFTLNGGKDEEIIDG